MRQAIQKAINLFGYKISKIEKKKAVDIPLSFYEEIYGKKAIDNKDFVNVGAGTFNHPAWTNVDLYSEWYKRNKIDMNWDLTANTRIPLDDLSKNVVYSSHTVEHITDRNAINLFDESYRILKKGGVLRVTTPNINLDYEAYKRNDKFYFYWCHVEPSWQIPSKQKFINATVSQLFLHHFASHTSIIHENSEVEKITDCKLQDIFSQMNYEDALNYCSSKCAIELQRKYPGNHINWWNYKKLYSMLTNAGFDKVYLSAYGQSMFPVLRDVNFFDNTHPRISLYVEAIKL